MEKRLNMANCVDIAASEENGDADRLIRTSSQSAHKEAIEQKRLAETFARSYSLSKRSFNLELLYLV